MASRRARASLCRRCSRAQPETEAWLENAMNLAAQTTAAECACTDGFNVNEPPLLLEFAPPRFRQEPEPPRFLDRRRQWYPENERITWNAARPTRRGRRCPNTGVPSEQRCRLGGYDNVTTFAPDDDGRGRDTLIVNVSAAPGWPQYVATARVSGAMDTSGYFCHSADRTLALCEEPAGGYDSRPGGLRAPARRPSLETTPGSATARSRRRRGAAGRGGGRRRMGGGGVRHGPLQQQRQRQLGAAVLRLVEPLFQLGSCIAGNHTHTGTDRWLVDCWGLAGAGAARPPELSPYRSARPAPLSGDEGKLVGRRHAVQTAGRVRGDVVGRGGREYRHPVSCYVSPWTTVGIFFGSLTFYLILHLPQAPAGAAVHPRVDIEARRLHAAGGRFRRPGRCRPPRRSRMGSARASSGARPPRSTAAMPRSVARRASAASTPASVAPRSSWLCGRRDAARRR